MLIRKPAHWAGFFSSAISELERDRVVKSIFVLVLLCIASWSVADSLVRDGEFTLSRGEVEYALAASPPQIRDSAKTDEASRYEFFVNLLVSKKVLSVMEALEEEDDPTTYYQFLFKRLEAARELDRQLFQNQLELPDFEEIGRAHV